MVDGEHRTITVAKPGHPDLVTTNLLRWHPANVTTPLELDVGALFREALG